MSVGGIVKYDKATVELNDGEFEILLIRNPDNILKLQPIIDGLIKREFDREGIEFLKSKKLTIETDEKLSWTLDGEFAETINEIDIHNLHNAITFIVP